MQNIIGIRNQMEISKTLLLLVIHNTVFEAVNCDIVFQQAVLTPTHLHEQVKDLRIMCNINKDDAIDINTQTVVHENFIFL